MTNPTNNVSGQAKINAQNFTILLGANGFVMAHGICAYTYDTDPRSTPGVNSAGYDKYGRMHIADYAKIAEQSRSTIKNYREAYFYAARNKYAEYLSEEVKPGEDTPKEFDTMPDLFNGRSWSEVYKASRNERTTAATAQKSAEYLETKNSTDPEVKAANQRKEHLKGFGWVSATVAKVPTEVHWCEDAETVTVIKSEIDILIKALQATKKLIKFKSGSLSFKI